MSLLLTVRMIIDLSDLFAVLANMSFLDPITHGIAGRLSLRPIDVLATMVGKTADTCQQELEAGERSSKFINSKLKSCSKCN